jgi:2,4-dienoyl-CoA reductase-like NADH-dependent reductase (Old Yellow Enzyme family)
MVFSEKRIGNIVLRNSVLRSATHEGLADENGFPTEKLIEKYVQLAKGEIGAIITGYAGIQQNGKSPFYHMLMIDNDDKIPAFKELTTKVHECGTPIILQIAHCGRQTRKKITGLNPVAPSALKDKIYYEERPNELSEAEISEIIHNFVAAIKRAKLAGFDGVQLHIAHGYLLSQFLSSHTNRRTDKWGGSAGNKFRIIKEILSRSRQEMGDFTILAKINVSDKQKKGIRIKEAIEFAKMLNENGIDAIETSRGTIEDGLNGVRGEIPTDAMIRDTFLFKSIPDFIKPVLKLSLKFFIKSEKPFYEYNLYEAKRIKENVSCPVIVVGGINSISQIRKIIEKDKIDFISMSRPLILEPDLIKKFKNGKQEKAKCLYCNICTVAQEARSIKCYFGKTN